MQASAPTLDNPQDYDPLCHAVPEGGETVTARLSEIVGDDADCFAEVASAFLGGAAEVRIGGGAAPLFVLTLAGGAA